MPHNQTLSKDSRFLNYINSARHQPKQQQQKKTYKKKKISLGKTRYCLWTKETKINFEKCGINSCYDIKNRSQLFSTQEAYETIHKKDQIFYCLKTIKQMCEADI